MERQSKASKPHLVDGDCARRLAAPLDEEIPAFLIEIRERQPAYASLLGGSDLGHFHKAIPESRSIDLKIAITSHIQSPKLR